MPGLRRVGCCLFFLTGIAASAAAQTTVIVSVHGVKEPVGLVRVALFDKPGDFLEDAAYGASVPASADEVVAVLADVSAGRYGVSVFHDANRNEELDTNFFGLPREGFGFGNDAMGMFGPPSFERASVDVTGDTTRITLRLRYF